jgi:hypothetical protein
MGQSGRAMCESLASAAANSNVRRTVQIARVVEFRGGGNCDRCNTMGRTLGRTKTRRYKLKGNEPAGLRYQGTGLYFSTRKA